MFLFVVVTRCADPVCGGKAAINAWISESDVIGKILVHMGFDVDPAATAMARAPPRAQLDSCYPEHIATRH